MFRSLVLEGTARKNVSSEAMFIIAVLTTAHCCAVRGHTMVNITVGDFSRGHYRSGVQQHDLSFTVPPKYNEAQREGWPAYEWDLCLVHLRFWVGYDPVPIGESERSLTWP